jgi:hypothetical protein
MRRDGTTDPRIPLEPIVCKKAAEVPIAENLGCACVGGAVTRTHGLYRPENRITRAKTPYATSGDKRITRAKRNAGTAFKNKASQSRKLYSRSEVDPKYWTTRPGGIC